MLLRSKFTCVLSLESLFSSWKETEKTAALLSVLLVSNKTSFVEAANGVDASELAYSNCLFHT